MIEGGVLEPEAGAAVDAATSTVAKGRPFDHALVLRVREVPSVAG